MKRFSILAACSLVCFVAAGSSAEIYRGMGPDSTLGDVKKKFPGAVFKKENPAWARERDAIYTVTGKGIEGTIVIKFDDFRPEQRRMMEGAPDNNEKDYWRHKAERSEDDALIVSAVRWFPDVPFSVDRLITKYGKPEASDFLPNNFQPYKAWTSRGILARLSDDEKMVLSIEFNFTEKEWKDALNAAFGPPPPPPPPPAQKAKEKKGKKGTKK